MSDHCAPFIALNTANNMNITNPKYIKVNCNHGKATQGFLIELQSVNWHEIFDHNTNANPSDTYKLFHDKLNNLHSKYFTSKWVKFNKYKHSKDKWMN